MSLGRALSSRAKGARAVVALRAAIAPLLRRRDGGRNAERAIVESDHEVTGMPCARLWSQSVSNQELLQAVDTSNPHWWPLLAV